MYVVLILALTPSCCVVVPCQLVSGDVFASVKVNTLNHEMSTSAEKKSGRSRGVTFSKAPQH